MQTACVNTVMKQWRRLYAYKCGIDVSKIPPSAHQVNYAPHDIATAIPQPEQFVQKACRVTILGALSTTGKVLALLIKQNPLISQLCIYDAKSAMPLLIDLRHVDTNSEIVSYCGDELPSALRHADIIVAMGTEQSRGNATIANQLFVEGKRLIELATASALHAPKAIFVNCVTPLSVTLPIVTEVYRRNHWYHPGKVVGSVAQQQMRMNGLLARHLEMKVSKVHVPLLGGPDEDIILPLFSRSDPKPLPVADAIRLLDKFRNMDALVPCTEDDDDMHGCAPYGNAFAINRLVSTIASGLLGDSKAISTAYVRTNFVGTCKYEARLRCTLGSGTLPNVIFRHLVSTVRFGPDGIHRNFGVPKLTSLELKQLDKVTNELKKREDIAKAFIRENYAETKPFQDVHATTFAFPAAVNFTPPDDDAIVVDS